MTKEQVLINHIQEYLDSGMWQYEACYLNKDDLKVIIKALKQEPCEDCISRKDVLDKIKEVCFSSEQKWVDFRVSQGSCGQRDFIIKFIKALPSVIPQKKAGHWIKYGIPICEEQHYQCTNCDYYINFGKWGELYSKEFKYCPNCGCRMVEGSE